jgi:phosphatidate cytidylyltransferase
MMLKPRRIVIKQRIITALIALPLLVLFIAFSSDWLFSGLICLLSALALHEFYRMSLPPFRQAEIGLAVVAGVIMVAGQLFSDSALVGQGSMILSALCMTLVYLFRFQKLEIVARDLAMTFFGFFYVPLLLAHAGLLHQLSFGKEWVFLVLFIVMASDSCAYFLGRQFGRRKLYEAISPNKSVEGAIGGLAGGVLGALLSKWFFFSALQFSDVLLLGLVVGAFSQIGDLVESMLKRSFGVKDSGTIIPGHGGLLDRLDSLLFAFPATYFYAVWVFGV